MIMIEKMMLRVAALWCLLASVCLAEYAVFSRPVAGEPTGWRALLGGESARMHVHFFRSEEMELCVPDEGDGAPRYGTLENAMKHERCTAGVNGGYFSAGAARTPIGLVRHAGRTIAPLAQRGFTVAGVVYDTGSGICLVRTSRLRTPVERMREAIQGGPFLVENGRVVPGLEKNKRAARTFVATDGAGRWCLATTAPLTLHELACWLAEPGALGKFRVQAALNLDGGSSSAFWDKEAGIHLPGFKAVRNYVGIRPRKRS